MEASSVAASLYTSLVRPLLFRLDAETVHHATVEACRWLGAVPGAATLSRSCLKADEPRLRTTVAGLRLANPIGLAAGWDKSGRALRMIDAMGFGSAEIGSVSARSLPTHEPTAPYPHRHRRSLHRRRRLSQNPSRSDARAAVNRPGGLFPPNRQPNVPQNLADLGAMMRRGCGIVMPHFYKNWQVEDLRRFILNGIVWTANLEVPAGGAHTSQPALADFQPASIESVPPPKIPAAKPHLEPSQTD